MIRIRIAALGAPMGVLGDGFQVDVLIQLHVLGVDPNHLQPPSLIWHTDINFPVEASKSAGIRNAAEISLSEVAHAAVLCD